MVLTLHADSSDRAGMLCMVPTLHADTLGQSRDALRVFSTLCRFPVTEQGCMAPLVCVSSTGMAPGGLVPQGCWPGEHSWGPGAVGHSLPGWFGVGAPVVGKKETCGQHQGIAYK